MSKELPISSSVDMSGDLSRRQGYSGQVSHRANVGTPIGGADYRPGKVGQQQQSESPSANAIDCVLVLGTISENNKIEYRVGKFANARQMDLGLSEPGVVRNCFGNSPVFKDRNTAVTAADSIYPRNCGIKVMIRTWKFPQHAI